MHSGLKVRFAGRYAAKKIIKPINFAWLAPGAKTVCLSGDFNDWHASSHPLKKQVDGAWTIQIPLPPGHHHYRFVVDGKPTLDPKAQGTARNEKNEKVSLVAVS